MGLLANGAKHQKCHLDYYHKDTPGPEPDNFTECHPWKDRACCAHSTVMTAQKLKEGYGEEYHWDRCGPPSPARERFFVQEACFYECDPHAGFYRRFPSEDQHTAHSEPTHYDPRCDEYDASYDASLDCSHNTWQLHKMPIKASYCDAWFEACKADLFCAADGGSFFSCAAQYEELDAAGLE